MHGQAGQARLFRHYLASPPRAAVLTCAYNCFLPPLQRLPALPIGTPLLSTLRVCRTVIVPLFCTRFGIFASSLELAESFYLRRQDPCLGPSTETLSLVKACSCAQPRFSPGGSATSLDCSSPEHSGSFVTWRGREPPVRSILRGAVVPSTPLTFTRESMLLEAPVWVTPK